MNASSPLLKVGGIEIRIHWTFILIILYIVFVNFKAGLNVFQIGWSVLFILSLFLCVTLHELGHALTAKKFGIKTKDITLYPIGGVARLEKMPDRPVQELIVALAGPLVNILIAGLLLPTLINSGFLNSEPQSEKAMVVGPDNFLSMLAIVNLWLALFNLIPAFPMDGGRVLRALLSMKINRLKATQIAATIGKFLAVFFVIGGFYTSPFNPFLVFIGLFIIVGAQAEAEMVKTQFFISDLKARDALMTSYTSLDKNQPLSDAVKLLLDGTAKNFLITDNGQPYGVLGRDQIVKGLSDRGEQAPVHLVATTELSYVKPGTPLLDVYTIFQQSKNPLVLIRENERLEGIIDMENIAELILVRNARQLSTHPG